MKNTFLKIIKEICVENNIEYKLLSKDFIVMLKKNKTIKFLYGYKFDLNNHGIGMIMDDKFGMYEVLKELKIPVIEHKIVYNKNNHNDYAKGCNTYEYVYDYFKKNNNHIVIKPNNGTCGNDVFQIKNIEEIEKVLNHLFLSNFSISMCPFYKIKHEYRVIVLNNNIELLYKKCLPVVFGDGKKTIKELLLDFNYNYFKKIVNDSKYNKVLKESEKFEYNFKFNLSQGAITKKVTDKELIIKLTKLAKSISQNINLNFGSIDIIETTNNELLVMEINSGVMLENYLILNQDEYLKVKDIYQKAIDSLFKK